MESRTMAENGLHLLKQAVVDYLAKKPGGAELTTTIRKDLGLAAPDSSGGHKDGVIWGVGNLLEAEGKARLVKRDGRNCLVLLPTV